MTLNITQEPADRTTLQLNPHTGEQLRSLILQQTDLSFVRYIESMGLQPNNVTNYLSGRNRISLAILQKLLAGTNLELTCTLQVTIENGNNVQDADSTLLDDMLFSVEPDMLGQEDTMTRTPFPQTTHIYSSSEKHPDPKMTTQDSPSREKTEGYSTSSSHLSTTPPFPTP